jgi:hypothetical protein
MPKNRLPMRTKQERLASPGYSQVENLWRKQLTRLVSHEVSLVSSSGTTKPSANSIAINHRNVRQITSMIVEGLIPHFPDKSAILNLCGDVSQTSPELFDKLRQYSHQCHSNTADVLRRWLENVDFWKVFIIEFEFSMRTFSRWSHPYYDYDDENRVDLYRRKIKKNPHVFEWLWHLTRKYISWFADRMGDPFIRLKSCNLSHFKTWLIWENQQYLTELPSTEPVKFVCINRLLNTVFQTVSQMSGFDSIACMRYFSGRWMRRQTINPYIFERVSFVFHPRLLRRLLSWSGLMLTLAHRLTLCRSFKERLWCVIVRKVISITGIAPMNRCLHPSSHIISVY